MKRRCLQKLEKWKNDAMRKPLLLMGARQVGKTWLMKEFGRSNYTKVAYIRFDSNEHVKEIFKGDLNIARVLESLSLEVGFRISPEDTLIVFDEIQECPAALTSLKYFCEEAREYHVVAAGSLLGVMNHHGTGFPVGKVDWMNLYPMSFCEFLEATGNEMYVSVMERGDWELLRPFHENLVRLLKTYFYVGGMPEAVSAYVETKDYEKVRQVQRNILRGYRNDFSKHAPAGIVQKLNLVWDSIPQQLSKENKRFIYHEVASNARRKMLDEPLRWLQEAGLIYAVPRVKCPRLPLPTYWEQGISKVFMLDVGLLGVLCELDAATLLEENKVFREFKGALNEQYVQQEIRANLDLIPCYWASMEKNSQAEVDFLCSIRGKVVPIEAKAGINTQAKSLQTYCKRFEPEVSIRTSLRAYAKNDMMLKSSQREHHSYQQIELPLYGLFRLGDEVVGV